jgi:uncharacterized membrane protein
MILIVVVVITVIIIVINRTRPLNATCAAAVRIVLIMVVGFVSHGFTSQVANTHIRRQT